MRELKRRSALDWSNLARANLVTIEATICLGLLAEAYGIGHGYQTSHAVACFRMRISPSVAPSWRTLLMG